VSQPTRRRRPTRTDLNREVVVDAALAIVDADGIDGLSMRKLATAIDVNPMTLYRFVPSKADLLRELVARVLADADAPSEASAEWEPVLRGTADAFRSAVQAHPKVLPLLAEPSGAITLLDLIAVPVLSLTLAGFSQEAAVHGASALTATVLGFAQLEAGLADTPADERPDPGRVVQLWSVAEKAAPDVQAVLGFEVSGGTVAVQPRSGADQTGGGEAQVAPVDFTLAIDVVVAGLHSL
jgi:AcrR family transcriptional regulator